MSQARTLPSKLPKLVAAVILVLVVAGMVVVIKHFIDDAKKPRKPLVQQISLIRPPPPKPEERPPEPPKPPELKEEVKIAEPVPEQPPAPNNEPPPAGLAPGPPGGMQTDLPPGGGIEIGGGSGGSRARWYAGLLAERIENTVNRDPDLVKQLKGKRPVVKVWVDTSGRVERVECESDVPNDIIGELKDKLLKLTLTEKPDGVAQPIWYRLRART